MIILNQVDREAVEEACATMGAAITEYSGRAMYGRECLAFVIDGIEELVQVFVFLADRNHFAARKLADALSTDDMGRRIVAYFPPISFAGFTESDDND
jgi:hypothetical protein